MKKNIWKSVFAVVVGAVVGIVLSIGTDLAMRKTGIFPESGRMMTNGLFVLATVYRAVYGVFGSYLTARLAPNRPMFHALVLGGIGTAVGVLGVVVNWNKMQEMGPHWYAIAIAALGMLQSWIGGKLRLMQLGGAGE